MNSSPRSLGAAELDVLSYVSDDFPVSVRDVMQSLKESHGYARTTVLTILERLREKKYLTRERTDGIYHYRPSIAPRRLMSLVVSRFVEEMLGGRITPILTYIARSGRLSAEEMSALTQIAKKLDAEFEK